MEPLSVNDMVAGARMRMKSLSIEELSGEREKGDALLVISGSGETPVSVGFAHIAKAEGAKVVTLTHKPKGTLASIADIVLPVPVEKTEQFGGSLFEQSCLVLLDSVILGLARQMPDAHKVMLHRHTNLQ